MRNLLISCFLTVCCSIAHAGAYEDILSAAGNDDTATVTSLLQRGMDVNTADRSGNTLLMIASRNGNLALMKSLIAARANVNRRNQHGDTALLLAALKPAPEAARLLVENGADLNPSGWTPLHYSILSGSKDIAALLVAKGAKVDSPAPNGQTSLMLAVKLGNSDLVQLLIKAGANLNLKDSDGLTALGLAKKLDQSEIAGYLRRAGGPE
jgi:ankyrin repeat protein